MNKSLAIVAAALIMVVGFITTAYFYNKQQTEARVQNASQNSAALTRADAPRKGNPKAKVTIVEFLDPACETCRVFHPFVKDLLKTYRGKLKVVIRYAPLHPDSDQMVKILEAAKKQGQFWSVLELMFETQDIWASHHQPNIPAFLDILEKTNIDMAQLKKDAKSGKTAKIIAQDIADGKLLGATKTPTFFVNGKPLDRFGYEELKALVVSEVSAKY